MDHEDYVFVTKDISYQKGLRVMRKECHQKDRRAQNRDEANNEEDDDEAALIEGKIKQEELKQELFQHLDKQ